MARALPLPCLAFALLLATPGLAQDGGAEEAAAPPQIRRTKNARKIRSLIRELGSPKWATREAAREALLQLGQEALPYLELATSDPDSERSQNARELVAAIRWLVPEELRRVVGDALDGFPDLPVQQRLQALGAFLQRPHEARVGVSWLITVARFDPEPTIRQAAVRVYLRVTPGADPRFDPAALEALADDEASPLLAYLRAQLFHRMERLDEAVAAIEEALRGAGANPEVVGLAIEVYLSAGRAEDALPLAKAAAERSPDDLLARIRLGEVLVRAGQRDEGLARLASVLGEAPKDEQGNPQLPPLEMLLRLGQAYLRSGEPDEAVAVYRQALGKYPFNRQLNVAMGDVLLAQGQVDEAVQVFLSEIRYVAIDPPSPEFVALRKRLGQVLQQGGAAWLAEQDAFFADAFRGRPVVEGRRAVAAWLRARGLFDLACEEQRAVTALAPSAPQAWLELGDVLRDAGDYAAAKGAFQRALALQPEGKAKGRLADLEVLSAQTSRGGPAPASLESVALWETRVEASDLVGVPEAVGLWAPPPVATDGVVVAPVSGSVALLGLSRQDGSQEWRYVPEPPAPAEGELPEQTGLEPVALTTVSPAVVAATHPARARRREPLVAALYNCFWRPAHRSWKVARFRGLYAYLLDPADGRALGRHEIHGGAAQVLPPAGSGRRGRLLAFVAPRPKRRALALFDLVLGKPLWTADVPRKTTRAPVTADEQILVAWQEGVRAIGRDGKKAWQHLRPVAGAPEEGEDEVTPSWVSTGLAVTAGRVVFGTTDGKLIGLGLEDGQATELLQLGEGRLVGSVGVSSGEEGRTDLFVAERGGAVHGLRVGAEGAKVSWRAQGQRVAARDMAVVGEVVFGLNGSAKDFWRDEAPVLQAYDPKDGKVLFRRPVVRPASLTHEGDLLLVSSGIGIARGGLRIIGALPSQRLQGDAALVLELRGAASDALAEEQFEVAAIVARKLVRKVGGMENMDEAGLEFLAKVLTRSRRREEALDVLHLAEMRAGPKGEARWLEVRKALGLELEEEEEAPPPEEPEKAPEEPEKAPEQPEEGAPPAPPGE